MIDPICPTRRLTAETLDGLPRPTPVQGASHIDAKAGFALPRPAALPLNVADTSSVQGTAFVLPFEGAFEASRTSVARGY
jgi:hypothetical protein